MPTSLAAQLQRVAQQVQQGHIVKKGKPSLLFDPTKASDIDAQTIYEISKEGFNQLLKKDARFYPFSESLYSPASISLHRDQLTVETIEKLNSTISSFLDLLSNYFLDPAAFKALEYLIRKYKVNSMNVDSLILCALPYHGTSEFMVVLKVSDLSSSSFAWLSGVKESDSPLLPRSVLVKRCLKDKAVLQLIYQAARRQGQQLSPCRAYLAFFAALACEVCAAVPVAANQQQEFIAQLLPYIVSGLEPSAAADYRAAVLMMLAELAGRLSFSAAFLTAVIRGLEALFSGGGPDSRAVLLLLARLASTQAGLGTLKSQLAEKAAGIAKQKLSELTLKKDTEVAAASVAATEQRVETLKKLEEAVKKPAANPAEEARFASQAAAVIAAANAALTAPKSPPADLSFLSGFLRKLDKSHLDLLQDLTPQAFLALPEAAQQAIFRRLLQLSGSGGAGLKSALSVPAAAGLLSRLFTKASLAVPILKGYRYPDVAAPAAPKVEEEKKPAPKSKKARKVEEPPAAAAAAAAAVAPVRGPVDISLAVLLLELLAWKTPQDFHVLLAPLQRLLQEFLPILGSLTQPLGEVDADEDDEEAAALKKKKVAAAAAAEVRGEDSTKSSLAGYAATLALDLVGGFVLRLLETSGEDAVGENSKGLKGVDVRSLYLFVSRFAKEAPDASVRNAALGVLGKLSRAQPSASFDNVLQVLSLVQESVALQDDEHTRAVCQTVISTVAGAWVAAGKDTAVLWEQVVGALPGLPAHRRLMPLLTLYNALASEERTLPLAVAMLLSAADKSPAAAGVATGADAPDYLDLASQLARQVSTVQRIGCLAAVLTELRKQLQEGGGGAAAGVPLTGILFVTSQLKLKATVSAAAACFSRPDVDPQLAAGCRALVQEVLSCFQSMRTTMAEGGAAARALIPAQRALQALLAALRGVMAADLYLQSLLMLVRAGVPEVVKRQALKLFAARVKTVRAEITDLIELPQRVRDAKLRQASDASVGIFKILRQLVSEDDVTGQAPEERLSVHPVTFQLVLAGVAAVASEFHREQIARIMPVAPVVLQATKDVRHSNIRASALATAAALVRALGTNILPVLPSLVQSILAAANAAWSQLAAAGGGAVADEEQQEKENASSGESSEDEDDEETTPSGSQASSSGVLRQQTALELAAALSTVSALVDTLGAFLSPQLPALLRLLLTPQVINCSIAGCDKFAAAIRSRLPAAVPTRLLLPPLFDQLPYSVSSGVQSVECLLEMAAGAITAVEAKIVTQYHEDIFAFVLKALDLRQRRPLTLASDAAAFARTEASAVKLLVSLVMKLSEARFRPLFLRMLDWASAVTVPESGASTEPTFDGRMIAFFAAVNALATRLRSVFVPYYRYILDMSVQHLSAGVGTAARSRKKQKRASHAAPAVPEADSPAAAVVHSAETNSWLLRQHVVRALHRCFAYDNVGFLDAEKFDNVLGPLVAQLAAEPPEAVPLRALVDQDVGKDLNSECTLGATTAELTSGGGPLGEAALCALVAAAVNVNSDALWKPLNHAVLMQTRASSARVRALGLEAVIQLVERLREEFLVLLPESLPFLAELLEDSDDRVVRRCKELIRTLEDISGEKLDQYMKV